MLRPRFDRALALARLRQLGISPDSAGSDLSGGEQAQVSLSIALGTHAEILLLDEPLASLDPLARRDLLEVVRDAVVGGSSTVVLASHLVADVDQACDQVVVLGRGSKLLDTSIAHALATHAIVTTPLVSPHDIVGRSSGRAGEALVLVNGRPTGSERVPTLEEIVLGYLASARAAQVDET